MLIIDIGCGRKKLRGAIGIDCSPYGMADIVLDLNRDPLPFENDSVDYVYSSHALEHLTTDGFFHIIHEIYRVIAPKGTIFLAVPYFSTSANLANPFHNNQICFNEHTFRFFSSEAATAALKPVDYFSPSTPQWWGLRYSANDEIGVELRTVEIAFVYWPEYAFLANDVQRRLRQQRQNVVEAIHYYLQPVKPCPKLIQKESLITEDPHEYISKQQGVLLEQQDWLANRARFRFPRDFFKDRPIWSPFRSVGAYIDAQADFGFERSGDLYRSRKTWHLYPCWEVVRLLNQRAQENRWVIDQIRRRRYGKLALLKPIARWVLKHARKGTISSKSRFLG